MSKWYRLGEHVDTSLKGITPSYVDHSDIIVLNQKCIRNNRIDFSQARFHNPEKKFSRVKILKKGDLLYNSTGQGTAGRCAFVSELPEDKVVITDSHILIVRIPDFNLAECFSYASHSKEALLQTFMDGSTGQGELDKLRLFNIEFQFPVNKKRKILCDVLNDLDDKIEVNNQINLELETMAKIIYEYWFLQFDFPDENGNPYKSSGGEMVYNELLKRDIPAGWEAGEAKRILTFNPNHSIPNQKTSSYLDMNSLPEKGFITKPLQKKKFIGGMKFKNGDVLVARITPCLENGKTALVSLLDKEEIGFGSTEFIVIRGKKMTLSHFTACFARSEYFRKYAIMNMTGTSGRKRVDSKNLELIPIPLPKERILKDFEELLYPIFERMTLTAKQNFELIELRNWLLPMLMNGQVSVREFENCEMSNQVENLPIANG